VDFEWDADKAEENLRKHKVSFAEAAETFSDPRGFAMADEKHSTREQRFYWIGMSESGRILTTRYTKRAGRIRIIGSGEWREFRKIYYEKAKTRESQD
jgi:uncharacterized DUF497 family protein